MSTRRARIKAVAALPQRRKNVDANKKKQDESKEGFESAVKTETNLRASFDKAQEQDGVTLDGSAKQLIEGLEVSPSPSKRRLSVEKSQGQRRLSIDKTGSVKDNEPKTLRARSSLDKTPKRRLSIDKTPAKRMSTEAINKDLPLPAEKSVQNTVGSDKDSENVSDKKLDTSSWFPKTKILKNLLDGSETTKTYLQSPFSNSEKVQAESRASTNLEYYENESRKAMSVPFFASPRGRASPRRPSPIVRTPVIAVDLIAEKFIAPHKGPNSMNNDMEDDANLKSNPEVEVIIEKICEEDRISLDNAAKKAKTPIKIIDEYIIKPVSETSTMDGIVPLQSASNAPKPLDLLKNEIISENAEVLFDPIVPLPSPSKVRPKLRPMPRLGPRRNSFQQGSASESEDENRRLHGRPGTPATPVPSRQRHDSHSHTIVQRDVARVRNDSVCSTVSQAPSQTATVSSPLREREKNLKTRREEMAARRNAAMRRRQTEVERDKLTMYDLIFYNPKANPIIPDQDELNAKEANKKDEERKAEAKQASSKGDSSPEPAPTAVPQIKLGPNGEIILDEQSLVVNQSEQRKIDASVIREGAWGGAGSRAYRRTPRAADWSDAETVRFYRALATMGTDFTLMQPLFPTRSRRDLKQKFKKEERMNLAQIDMALRSGAKWDPSRLETEFTKERKAAEVAAEKAKERLKLEKEKQKQMREINAKRSRCSKTLGDSTLQQAKHTRKPTSLDEYLNAQSDSKTTQKRLSKRQQVTPSQPTGPFATLTRVGKSKMTKTPAPVNDMATITSITKDTPLPASAVPPNIEAGSLVVLTVNDPQSPSRKMLQTYIAQGPGNLTPVSLPANLLNSVVGFMKKSSSPASTVLSSPKTRSKTPNILSPRKRTSSYTITQL